MAVIALRLLWEPSFQLALPQKRPYKRRNVACHLRQERFFPNRLSVPRGYLGKIILFHHPSAPGR